MTFDYHTYAMNPKDPDYVHGDCELMKLGDINKDCTCGGHSEYCAAKDAGTPRILIMDPEFYADLRSAVATNGADKMKLAIEAIAREEE